MVSPRSLVVSVEPPNAQILINGQKVASPTVELKEAELQDSLTVDIMADGHEKWNQTIRVGPGVQHELHVHLNELKTLEFIQEPEDPQNP